MHKAETVLSLRSHQINFWYFENQTPWYYRRL